ncbi:MAG: RseA family anti-sigma factor [Woeseiaceae bacterium]|nr:RseA family anti-sigma factor [Woeseiaceae bacterium]
MNDAIKMQISAFVDGELPQNEAELLLRRLCQDGELRQQAAEYMAVGRIMRGEKIVVGMAQLRERIAAELDDENVQLDAPEAQAAPARFARPLAGLAIAATVAVVALLGLQQLSTGPADTGGEAPAVAEAVDGAYTVPQADEDPLRDYYQIHNASASYVGAGSINARLVDFQVREDLVLSAVNAAETVEADAEPADDAETPAP